MTNKEKAEHIAKALATAPRRMAVARAMDAVPKPFLFEKRWLHWCDYCGWGTMTQMSYTTCPKCGEPVGCRLTGESVLNIWQEKPE